jgi:hypothetical protein
MQNRFEVFAQVYAVAYAKTGLTLKTPTYSMALLEFLFQLHLLQGVDNHSPF